MNEKHHIVFRSQCGLDFPMNLIELTPEEHRGDNGPHKCRATDLRLKKELQKSLYELFPEAEYSAKEVAGRLRVSTKYIERKFKHISQRSGVGRYRREDIIKRLMGGRFY